MRKDYTFEALIGFIVSAIQGSRHRDYDRTVDHSEWCYQMMTGDNQEEIVLRYKHREELDQKEERIKLTNSRTQYVGNKVFNLYSEVHRADRTVNSVSLADTEEGSAVLQGLLDNLQAFNGKQSLEAYLDVKFKHYNFYDPNAWLIIEFVNPDPNNAKPTVFPYEVASSDALDFEYYMSTLQWLITREAVAFTDAEGETIWGYSYTLYYGEVTIRITVYPEGAVRPDVTPTASEYWLMVQPNENEGGQLFGWVEIFDTRSALVPAMRFGSTLDPTTNGRTFVSPMYPAEKILTDLIWRKSEYDLSHALHGFYQKFIYVDECSDCNGSGKEAWANGTRACGTCLGAGVQTHISVSDVIEVLRPEAPEHIPLSEFVHYEQIPMDLIRLQKEDVKELERDCFNAIFGSNVLDRAEVAVTATEKTYDWNAVNNTLLAYADSYADLYRFAVTVAAIHRQESTGLVVAYRFPSDFNLESIESLIDQRKKAIDAGAPYEVVSHFDLNVVSKQNRENPAAVALFRAIERWRPLRDKAMQERIFVLTTLLAPDDPQRVLYTYFDEIMMDVTMANRNFPILSYPAQRTLVDAAVAQKIAELNVPTGSLAPEAE